MTFSIELPRNDPDFLGLFKKKANEIRETKANLLSAASEYQSKYANEINEGTEKRKLLLEEGKKKGLKEEDVFRDYQVFIPNAATPILNYLFFMMREKDYSPSDAKTICEAWEKEHGSLIEEADVSSAAVPNSTSFIYVNIGDETFSTIKKLKTLSYSRNTAEADVAYKKCIDLCRKYSLEFDKIPVNN
jgi:hypothetical protein